MDTKITIADRNRCPTVSVIIPIHNNAQSLMLVLTALRSQTSRPEEIICVDDASNGAQYREISLLAAEHNARLLRLPLRRHPLGRRSAARNMGTLEARGLVVLYIDGDMLLTAEYVATIKRIHSLQRRLMVKGTRYSISEQDQARGDAECVEIAIQSQTRTHVATDSVYGDTPMIDRANDLDTSLPPFCMHRLPYSGRWDHCASNNLSVHRSEVTAVGLWDEAFLGWGEEDMDLAYRLYRNGCTPVIYSDPPLAAYHLDHPIDEQLNRQSLARNACYFFKKYPRVIAKRLPALRYYGINEQSHSFSFQ